MLRSEEAALFENPTGKCYICGNDTGAPKSSKLISGTFHRCSEHDDEYVFSPLEVSKTADLESLDFKVT